MANATITITETDGALTLLTTYEGGFDRENPAHQAAALLGAKMTDLAEPQSPLVDLSAQQVADIQAGGLPAAIASLRSGLVEPVEG